MNNLFKYTLAWLTFATLILHAADTPARHSSETFTKALMAEERELDLEKAADLYANVIQRFDASRERAGNAIFRRAECLRKQGDATEAKLLYARILREFSDLHELVQLSQAKLQIHDALLGGEKEVYTVALSSDEPEICFENVSATLSELEQKLSQVKEAIPEARIALVTDPKTSFEHVEPVLKMIEKIGFQDVLMRVDALTKKSKEAQNALPEIIRFKILGEVNKPGFYEVPRDIGIDLLDAIAIAGGYEKLADDVTLKYTDEGKEKVETFKLRDLKRTPESQIPKLRTNATIMVGESIF